MDKQYIEQLYAANSLPNQGLQQNQNGRNIVSSNGGFINFDNQYQTPQKSMNDYLDAMARERHPSNSSLGIITFPITPVPVIVPGRDADDKKPDAIAPELMHKRVRDW